VRSVERAARVWQALLRSGRKGRRVTELSQELDLHKTTVVRLLQTLVAIGVVRKSESTEHYACEPTIWLNLIYGLRDLMSAGEMVQRIVDELAEQSGETVLLGAPALEGRGMKTIAFALSPQPIRVDLRRGSTAPMHAVAAGKAYLSTVSEEELSQWMASGIAASTPHTVTDPEMLRQELARARERGYAITREEQIAGTGGIGVPVSDDCGRATAALQVATPVERLTEANIERWGPLLKEAAEKIGHVLYLSALGRNEVNVLAEGGAGDSADEVETQVGETPLQKRYPTV
jgi:IclR family acetate operon transcriptional repressor